MNTFQRCVTCKMKPLANARGFKSIYDLYRSFIQRSYLKKKSLIDIGWNPLYHY